MYLIGITGMIASGKTTVAKLYKEMGAYLLDADKLAHEKLKNSAIKKRVVEAFGKEILGESADINRTRVAEIVFSDSEKLEELNTIMEKPITSALRDRIMELQEGGFPGVVAVDAAMLPRWNMVKAMDVIVLVEAPKWQLMNRLVRQRGLQQEDAERRIEAQENMFREFHPKQQLVVKNNGDFIELRTNAMQVWMEIKERTLTKIEK